MAHTPGQPATALATSAPTPAVDSVEAALQRLLALYPTARVAAITSDPTARLVAVPPSVAVGPGHTFIPGESLIHLVSAPDQAIIARLWSRARTVGYDCAEVRLITDPPADGTLHFLDLTSVHGAMVVLFAEGGREDLPELSGLIPNAPAGRLGRVSKDGSSTIIGADRGLTAVLGWRPQEVVGRRSLELIHPDDQELAIESWIRMLEFPGASRAVRLRHRHRDGRWVWVEIHNHNRLADPEHGDVVAEVVDISEEVAAQEAVRVRQQLLEQLTETVPVGLFHADLEGHLLYVNRRLTEITGLPVGSRLSEWPGLCAPHFAEVIDRSLEAVARGSASESVIEVFDPAGDVHHCSMSLRPLADQSGAVAGVTGAVEDITRSVVERRELEVRAATDPLTGCLNRSATLARLQDALDDIRTDGRPDGAAVIFVDVDGLKELNDGLGHQAGDVLLIEVADRLREAVRAGDSVGRYGGDEFVVLVTHVSSAEQALTVARWLATRTLRPVTIEGRSVDLRFSLGVAWTGTGGVQATWLVRRADAAMYRSKQAGRCEPVVA